MANNYLTKQNSFFRQLLFLALLITLGLIIFKQLRFLLGAFLGASTLYIILRKYLFRMTEQRHVKGWVASLILVTITTVFLLIFGYVVYEVLASELPNVTVDVSQVVDGVNDTLAGINQKIGYKLVPDNIMSEGKGVITQLVTSLLNVTYTSAINIFLMLIILYFMLASGRRMEQKALLYMPFHGKGLILIEQEVKNVIYSNAVGIPIIMLSQGTVAYLIYLLFGIGSPLLWAFLTAIAGLIPMVGTSLVTVPLGIYMIAGGEVWQGLVLIACGLLVIANADNVCRILLMKKIANTHALIVIFGVIMGIPLFGFWGIIFGPLLISLFLLLIRIYYIEYHLFCPPTETPLAAEDQEHGVTLPSRND